MAVPASDITRTRKVDPVRSQSIRRTSADKGEVNLRGASNAGLTLASNGDRVGSYEKASTESGCLFCKAFTIQCTILVTNLYIL